jgi:hypothetical protein
MYHYVYSITYTDVPNIYYGSRSCKRLPWKDTSYWGSPQTFKAFMEEHKATRVKTILAIYNCREDANLEETILIRSQWKINKSLSLNSGTRKLKLNDVTGKNLLIDTSSQAQEGVVKDEDNVIWSAFIPANLTTPVLAYIRQYGDKGGWHCDNIGLFDSDNELVRHYLAIKDYIRG